MTKLFARLVLFLALIFATCFSAQAQEQVEITGDSLVVAETKNTATFSGNVIIKQPGLTVWANKVIILYGSGGSTDIKTLEAIGRIKIKTETQTVTGDRGVYDPKAQIMRVSGNVVTESASGTVKGPEMLVDFANNTTEFVKKEGGRVTGVFNQ